jgi:hypothetical protein
VQGEAFVIAATGRLRAQQQLVRLVEPLLSLAKAPPLQQIKTTPR